MKKLISLVMSLLILVSAIAAVSMTCTAEGETVYVPYEDFESYEVGTTYARWGSVSSAFSNGNWAGGKIASDAGFVNAETESTKSFKIRTAGLGYGTKASLCSFKFKPEQFLSSKGFRYWVAGDETTNYTVNLQMNLKGLYKDGEDENWEAKRTFIPKAEGQWETVTWGAAERTNPYNQAWYHNGGNGPGYVYYFPTAEEFATLSSVSISLYILLPATVTPQSIYIDDVQLAVDPAAATQYDVSLDGVVTKVDEGADFTFPALSDTGIAYTDGTDYYKAGDAVTVNENLSFTTVDLGLSMGEGASMRLNNVSGVRFYTGLNTGVYNSLKAAGAEISIGTLIAPTDLLGGEELTLDVNDDNKVVVLYESDSWFEPSTFVGSIANVKDKNAKRNFVGRGYATVTFNGVTKTVYASYFDNNIANNTRQIGWIAGEIKKVDATTGASEYDTLSPAQKAVVDKYYNLYMAD